MEQDKKAYTTTELASLAGLTSSRIRQLLIAGVIKGDKFGRDWSIPKLEAERWLKDRK